MNELKVVDIEQKDITTWDFAGIKSELKSALAIYKTSVYTDETIKWRVICGVKNYLR